MPYDKYCDWQKACLSEMFRLIKDDGAIFYNNRVVGVYPARVKFRGFESKFNDEGYVGISKYIKDNAEELYKETVE